MFNNHIITNIPIPTIRKRPNKSPPNHRTNPKPYKKASKKPNNPKKPNSKKTHNHPNPQLNRPSPQINLPKPPNPPIPQNNLPSPQINFPKPPKPAKLNPPPTKKPIKRHNRLPLRSSLTRNIAPAILQRQKIVQLHKRPNRTPSSTL